MKESTKLSDKFPVGVQLKAVSIDPINENEVVVEAEVIDTEGKVVETRRLYCWEYQDVTVDDNMVIQNFRMSRDGKKLFNPNSTARAERLDGFNLGLI